MCKRDDVARASARIGAYGLGLKSTYRNIDETLPPQEKVLSMVSGKLDRTFGVLTLTRSRLLFRRRMLGVVRSREFPLDTITSMGTDGTPIYCKLTITFAGGHVVVSEVPSKLGGELVEKANGILSSRGKAPVNARTPASQLLQLKQLLDAGVLTEEEYEAKASVLKDAL